MNRIAVLPAAAPDPDVIEQLESLLERAKTGEIGAFAWIADTPTRFDTGFVFSGSDRMAALGALSLLEHRIRSAIDDEG